MGGTLEDAHHQLAFEALVLLITHKKNRKDTIAFAPAVLAGTIAAVAMTGL